MKLQEALGDKLAWKLSSTAKALLPKSKGQAKVAMGNPKKSAQEMRVLIKRWVKDVSERKMLMNAADEYESALAQKDVKKSAYYNALLNDIIRKRYENTPTDDMGHN